MPIVDDDGALAGVMTERALARRYIRESREPSELDAPTQRRARSSSVLQGELISGARTPRSPGRSGAWRWTSARCRARSAPATSPSSATATTRSARRSSSASGCWSRATGRRPTEATLALAADAGVPVVGSPLDSYVTARMITLSAPCRALMDPEPLTVRPGRPALRRRRRGQGGPLPGRGRGRRGPPPDRPRDPHRPAEPAPAPRAAGRPRRAGAERPRRRAGRDRRDPRPPPHRLDRDDGAGAGDVRPGRLDRDAGDRALPPERDGAEPLDGDAAAVRDPLRHGDPQLADDDRARPRRRRVPRSGCWRSTPMALGREMFEATSDLAGVPRRRDRHARRQGVRGQRRAHDRDRPGRDRRPGARRPPRGAAGGDAARRASAAATRSTR